MEEHEDIVEVEYETFVTQNFVIWKNPDDSRVADFNDRLGDPPYMVSKVESVLEDEVELRGHPQLVTVVGKDGSELRFTGAWLTKY